LAPGLGKLARRETPSWAFHQDMNVSTPILEAVFVELAKDFYTNGDMSIPKHEENTLIHENKISSKTPSVLHSFMQVDLWQLTQLVTGTLSSPIITGQFLVVSAPPI
jgi:hypothetical protein